MNNSETYCLCTTGWMGCSCFCKHASGSLPQQASDHEFPDARYSPRPYRVLFLFEADPGCWVSLRGAICTYRPKSIVTSAHSEDGMLPRFPQPILGGKGYAMTSSAK